MQVDPILPVIVSIAFAIFLGGFVLRTLRQPHVIGYIIAGVLLGYLGLVQDQHLLEQLGNLGIVLLLFFIGMHVSLPKLVGNWRVAIIGTLLQIMLTVVFSGIIGYFLAWPLARILLFGFVVSLSSTAVILNILEQWKELDTKVGQNVLAILLVQDLAIIPMIMALDFLKGGGFSIEQVALQAVGALLMLSVVMYVFMKERISIPFLGHMKDDREMQIFVALVVCFGFALATGLLGLSTALGAFVAGLFVSSIEGVSWIRDSLDSIRVILVALFFVYIGVLIDLSFILENLALVLSLVFGVLLLNTLLNMLILLWLGDTWQESLYAGGLLAQIGEFSFLLAAIGFANGFLLEFGYQLIIAIIAITLLISPPWIQVIKRVCHLRKDYVFEKS